MESGVARLVTADAMSDRCGRPPDNPTLRVVFAAKSSPDDAAIRRQVPKDAAAVRDVIGHAFEVDPVEVVVLEKALAQRSNSTGYVALVDDRVVGHVRLTRGWIDAGGAPGRGARPQPLSVTPELSAPGDRPGARRPRRGGGGPRRGPGGLPRRRPRLLLAARLASRLRTGRDTAVGSDPRARLPGRNAPRMGAVDARGTRIRGDVLGARLRRPSGRQARSSSGEPRGWHSRQREWPAVKGLCTPEEAAAALAHDELFVRQGPGLVTPPPA